MENLFQDVWRKIENFWVKKGCLLWRPYNVEVGAGTLNPATFFGILGNKKWNVVYIEPSVRPADGRYGDNPVRLYLHHQIQVIMKPPPDDIQKIYLKSLEYIGIPIKEHDIRFIEDNWEAPTLGAWGVGWEVWIDGLEITQFTYMQQAGGIDLLPPAVEITYGLDRIVNFLQNEKNVFNLKWNKTVKYGDIYKEREREYSIYSFEVADINLLFEIFDKFEKEAERLLEIELIYPAYDYILKLSHIFNLLDSRKAISVSERVRYIQRVRKLANKCALLYIEKGKGII
ncbi:MAG: glycine--tRNA ligase subunit alpha [candidate division WOR-3 bacterium]|nr:glycine--tRNA ligase subunit alpha [Candidatus Omnitrophota bacterium]MCM8808072.1 glycine--tRNA ligase subunit alpha [Candidatus Omnitrophota bacterium]